MKKTEFCVAQVQDWQPTAETVSRLFKKKQLVLLSGPLGAGKTTFVQALVQALGGKNVSSPTYAIHQEYPIHRGRLDHVDLYRLEDFEDLESTGFWDLFRLAEGLLVVEWADRLATSDWPSDWSKIWIEISLNSNDERLVKVRS